MAAVIYKGGLDENSLKWNFQTIYFSDKPNPVFEQSVKRPTGSVWIVPGTIDLS